MKSWRLNWLIIAIFSAASCVLGVGITISGYVVVAIVFFGLGLGFALGSVYLRRLTIAYDREMLALHEQDLAARLADDS